MKKIGVFYGTITGMSKSVAEEVEFYLKDECSVYNIIDGVEEIKNYDNLIFIIPSYGVGEPAKHWADKYDELRKIDFSEKKVAIIGLGNQTTFGESFLGGVVSLHELVEDKGAKILGYTPTTGYHYEECEAIIDDKFMCLAIDEVNQSEDTPKRIEEWVEGLKKEFN